MNSGPGRRSSFRRVLWVRGRCWRIAPRSTRFSSRVPDAASFHITRHAGDMRRRTTTPNFLVLAQHEILFMLTSEIPHSMLTKRIVMDTVTVAASRGFTLSEMEILVGSAVVLAVLALTVFTSLKHLRSRQMPRTLKN